MDTLTVLITGYLIIIDLCSSRMLPNLSTLLVSSIGSISSTPQNSHHLSSWLHMHSHGLKSENASFPVDIEDF